MGGSDAVGTTAAPVTSSATETTVRRPELPDKKYDGYVFKVGTHICSFQNYQFTAEEQTGEPINDAFYLRNREIEEKYGVSIVETEEKSVNDVVTKAVQAGDETYSIVFGMANSISKLGVQGMLCDLNEVPYLDLSFDCWDQNAREDLAVGGKLYFMVGDLHIGGFTLVEMMIFNKDILNSYKLENPYDLVKNGSWTYDKLAAMGKAVVKDLNGDGKLDTSDQWGITHTCGIFVNLLMSGGGKFYTKDADGWCRFNMANEEFYTLYDNVLRTAAKEWTFTTTGDSAYSKLFYDGQALFLGSGVGGLTGEKLREAEFEYGIAPLPKLDEKQDRWYANVNIQSEMLCVPITAGDLERTGALTEALCYASTDTLREAYYEVSCKTKYVYDEDAADVLDVIYASRMFDVGMINSFGNLRSKYMTYAMAYSTDIASFVASIQSPIETEIKAFKG